MPDRVIRVAAAIIVDDGRVLVVRKRGTTVFMQPGGKVDTGETALAAMQRELHEELDVRVPAAQIRALGRRTAVAANEPGHVVEAELFLVTLAEEPHASAEIDEMTWIDPAAPGDIELAPLTRDAVLDLVRQAHLSSNLGSARTL